MRLLIAIVIWLGAVAGGVAVSSVVADSIHTKATTTSTGPSGSVTTSSGQSSGSTQDASSVTASDKASLFRTANFAKALATARSALGANAKVENFALYPGYLSITAVSGSGETDFYVSTFGLVTKTTTGGSPGGMTLFRLSKISADAPATLAARISRLAHIPVSQLHYMVAQAEPPTGTFRWLTYTVDGSKFEYFETPSPTGPISAYRSGGGFQRIGG